MASSNLWHGGSSGEDEGIGAGAADMVSHVFFRGRAGGCVGDGGCMMESCGMEVRVERYIGKDINATTHSRSCSEVCHARSRESVTKMDIKRRWGK